ncbi:MAG: hypothetical protein ACI4V1_06305, partial [Eubacteriales bacterium]
MSEFFVLLLAQVTLFSSVTALILIAVKQIFKCRIPPLIGTMMWVVLLARLLCPIFPESRISVYNFIPVGRDIMFTLTYDVGKGLEEQEKVRTERDNPYVLQENTEPETAPERAEVSAAHSSEETRDTADGIADMEGVVETAARTETFRVLLLSGYLLGIAVMLTWHIYAYFRAKRMELSAS